LKIGDFGDTVMRWLRVAPNPMIDFTPDPLGFLYPEWDTHAEGYLAVGEGHQIWWEVSGNPAGRPVLLLHGGPGAPTGPFHRRFFDPRHFRLVVMHQRGCGKSTPIAELRGNTTQALVADIEALRAHLVIERWLVAGGSWGTCLALAYGEAHPERCAGFCLTGVSLGREVEIDWWWNGTRMIFPEAWDALIGWLPPHLRDDPLAGYYRQVTSPDPEICEEAAFNLCLFSAATVGVAPDPEAIARYRDPAVSLPLARLALHYNVNRFFLRPGQHLDELHRITHLPCTIVSGRYDVTTAAEGGWTLHKAWPGSTREVVGGAAHRLGQPEMAWAFLAAIEVMKDWP
jgi:proline iminopeptidase